MSSNKASENKSDNESENKYNENESHNDSDNESKNESDYTADHNPKNFDVENFMNKIVTMISKNDNITDQMAENIGDHIRGYLCDNIKDIVDDLFHKHKPENKLTIDNAFI